MKNSLKLISVSVLICVGSNGQVMPVEYEDVFIGMSWEELVEARPNASLINFGPDPSVEAKPDPEVVQDGLMEINGSGSVKMAMYQLKAGRLCGVTFTYTMADHLLIDMLEKYGKFESVENSAERGYGIVRWLIDDITLYLTVHLANKRQGLPVVYQIMNAEAAQEFEKLKNEKLEKRINDESGLLSFRAEIEDLNSNINEESKPELFREVKQHVSIDENESTIEEPAEVVVAEPIEEDVEQLPNWWLWLVGAVIIVGGIILLCHRRGNSRQP